MFEFCNIHYCWGPLLLGSIPMVVGLPQLETKLNAIICGRLVFHNLETKLNAIICGRLVFHNWRHFFFLP